VKWETADFIVRRFHNARLSIGTLEFRLRCRLGLDLILKRFGNLCRISGSHVGCIT